MADHTERAHAKYSPSSAKRWLKCPGSVKLIEELPERKPTKANVAADRGTLCHMATETALRKKRFSLKSLVGKLSINDALGKPVFFTEDMIEPVQKAVKEAREFMKFFPTAIWEFEVKLQPLSAFPDCWGTVDMLGIVMGKQVIVCDFKFGNGYVGPLNNPQLKTYGMLGAIPAFLDFNEGVGEVIGKIIQPPKNTKAQDYVTYSAEEMKQFYEDVIVSDGLEDLHPDDTPEVCGWCEAKSVCKAYTAEFNQKMTAAFSPVVPDKEKEASSQPSVIPQVLPTPSDVKPEAVQHILAFKKVFDEWYKEFISIHQQKAIDEGAMPGTKVVTGRKGNRKWAFKDDEIIDHLTMFHAVQRKSIVKEKVVTVREAEKVLNETAIKLLTQQGRIVQEEGKPVLALEDDKRRDYDITKLFLPVGE